VIAKLLKSAASNAEHNDGLDVNELYVSTCYADEGATLKRWRPRARGRATRIRKRTCHITIILSRMPEDQILRRRARAAAEAADRRARRVAGTRRREREEQIPAGAVSSEADTDLVDDVASDQLDVVAGQGVDELAAGSAEPTSAEVLEDDDAEPDEVASTESASTNDEVADTDDVDDEGEDAEKENG
jgi:large subunit ribosomal protein L22